MTVEHVKKCFNQYSKDVRRESAVQVRMIAGFHPGSCGSFLGFEACVGYFQI